MNKHTEFVKRLKVRFSQRLLLVLEKASNLEMLLLYLKTLCSFVSIIGKTLSDTTKKKEKLILGLSKTN